jgi:hypothetical protein
MQLQNLQLDFADAIQSGDQPLEFILPAQNMRIYQNNVQTNLVRALKQTYPMIVKLVGEDFFRMTANEYIKQYPSRSGDLNDYGQYFSDFLAEFPAVKDLIYLAEVAQFEWTCHTLLCAASNTTSFDAALLNRVAPEHYDQIHFNLHPASCVMKFYYPILRIIDLCKGEIADNVDLSAGGVYLLIIRRELDIHLISLSESEFSFLTALQDNLSLATALETALQIDENFLLDKKLSEWIREQIIVDCCLSN